MVGNHAQGNIFFLVLMIFHICDLHNVLHDVLHGIHFKQVVHILRNARKTLQAHACVNVGVIQTGVVVVAVIVKLGENQVPKLNVAVTFTADFAVGLTAAVFFAAVIVNFRAGAARTCAVLPEVVRLAETHHMVGLNADFLGPNIVRLVVLFIDADVKALGIHFHHFGAELPRPRNDLFFKIIAERKVAEHLKVCAVTGGFADIFNVGCANTLLAGGDALSRGRDFPRKVFFHRCHTGIDQKQAFVALGHERKARQA